MEKNNLIMFGLLGALGVGAYLLFTNQDQSIGGSGAPGGARPGSELGSPNYIFNIAAPVFPDLMSFFTDTGTTTTTTAAKKDTPIIINQADYKPGSLVIVPIKNTIPSMTGGQNFPTVVVSSKKTTAPYSPAPAQSPLKIQNIFGFPVVPHLTTASTPAQQIEQYNIAPRIINGRKVM